MAVNLPNQITLARLVLAIVFFVLLAQFSIEKLNKERWYLDVCLVIFVVAAVTDWLDGWLARRNNQVTAFGRVLDPFVDKVLVCGTFVLLAGPAFQGADGTQVTRVAPWMVVLILSRELLVTGLRGFSESRGTAFGANVYGKAKMIIQVVTASALLLLIAHFDGPSTAVASDWIKVVLVWLTVITTTLSMVSYLYQARNVLVDAVS